MVAATRPLALAGAFMSAVAAAKTPKSLSDICTPNYARSALRDIHVLSNITIDLSSVETTLTTNSSVSSEWYPSATISFCNLTLGYSHTAIPNDKVHVTYWLPAPSAFKNRYVSTGGGGLAINSGTGYIPSGVIVGAVSGITDGGFGNFNTQWDAVFLESEGFINWQSVYMFGYQAHRELAVLGKALARSVYNVAGNKKIYSYYQGCSEGGREGWSQLQRYADQFDGAAIGAPAIRYAQQQVNHLTGNVIEQTMGYYPPSCELDKIAELMIEACDGLDGRTDGIISRSDLCNGGPPSRFRSKRFNNLRRQMPQNPTPAQNGSVTAEGAAVVGAFLNGLFDNEGRRVYLPWPHGITFADAATAYDSSTGTWGLSISDLGGEWVARYLQLKNTSALESLDGVIYDTLKEWMQLGMDRYYDVLQTTNPDLAAFRMAGGKVLHVHGEADNSIPPASSIRYYESVRKTLYPSMGFNQSVAKLDDFYRLYLVPGAAHCGSNSAQPGSPWPQTTLQTVIDWVEKGKAPDMLAASGDIDSICRWPLRPMWREDGVLTCEYDQASIDTWVYDLNSWDEPIY
ncbi:tannase and feruloyl esterase [Parathielavia appendiculata]|uniref:Carboxylic ester hydrolase n=1 Tax=Parathielavia appendiculata TaxID=2587402 RepID=A0AAN6TY65_9PEZI|nr:tannase and feruloyl esterase [Parathielavia appendiculata]